MARSSMASYEVAEDIRDSTQQGSELRSIAANGLFGLRDLAERSVEQTREAFLGVLSTTQKTMTTFDQHASELRQNAWSLATKTVEGAFELARNLARARSAEELMQFQAEFAQAQV